MNRVPSIFTDAWVLSLLLAMPLLSIAQFVAAWRSRRQLMRVGQPIALIGLLPIPQRRRWLIGLITGLAMTALAAGAAGPRWGLDADPQVVAGRDLIVVIDMSNSMRATDAPPDRFRRAVEGARDLAAYVRTRGGHRLGLIVFAGDAQVVCPLTHDYDHFRSKLDALSMDAPPPGLLPRAGMRSGTRFGAAMRHAIAAHDPAFKGFQDVLLISDGHDPLGNDDWQSGLNAIAESGVPIYTVGVGDPATGAELSVPGRSEKVRTRLQEYPLQEIAKLTGGFYLGARVDSPKLGELFKQRIESKGTMLPPGDAPPLPQSRQAWFYGAALGLFGLAGMLQLRREDFARLVPRRRTPTAEEPIVLHSSRRVAASILVLITLLGASPLMPEDWERRGHTAFDAGRFDEAALYYSKAGDRTAEPGRVAYNAGVANFNLGRYREAERLFRAALESQGEERKARALYNLGTCLLHASTGRDAERLGEAIDAFGRCALHAGDDHDLKRHALHNQELAKQLWRRLGDEPPPPERDPTLPDHDRKNDPPEAQGGRDEGTEPGAAGGNGPLQPVPSPGVGPGPKPAITDQDRGPGRGNMSPLNDQEQLGPLPAHEAREQLRKAGERIARERRALLRPATGPREYPDW